MLAEQREACLVSCAKPSWTRIHPKDNCSQVAFRSSDVLESMKCEDVEKKRDTQISRLAYSPRLRQVSHGRAIQRESNALSLQKFVFLGLSSCEGELAERSKHCLHCAAVLPFHLALHNSVLNASYLWVDSSISSFGLGPLVFLIKFSVACVQKWCSSSRSLPLHGCFACLYLKCLQ